LTSEEKQVIIQLFYEDIYDGDFINRRPNLVQDFLKPLYLSQGEVAFFIKKQP